MEETTLVLLWDEVFQELLKQVVQLLEEDKKDVIEQAFLLPLKAMFEQGFQWLGNFVQNPDMYQVWVTFAQQLFSFMYIAILILISGQILYHLGETIMRKMMKTESEVTFILPIRKFLYLQCIHFIGQPIIFSLLEGYPNFVRQVLQYIYSDKGTMIKLESFTYESGSSFLQVVFLGVITVFFILLVFQFLRMGFDMMLVFVKYYVYIFLSDDATPVVLLKSMGVRIVVIFVMQQFLLYRLLFSTYEQKNLQTLCMLAVQMVVIYCLPKFLTRKD